MSAQDENPPFLYVVVCAAGIAADVGKLITAAQRREWHVGVIATPVAMNGFFDTAAVEAQTGRPIRSAWRRPGEPRPFPDPDAVVVAPATFNTVNKWADGVADTLVAAWCDYGRRFPAAIEAGPVWATQFHPEKSGAVGMRLMQNFVEKAARARAALQSGD